MSAPEFPLLHVLELDRDTRHTGRSQLGYAAPRDTLRKVGGAALEYLKRLN